MIMVFLMQSAHESLNLRDQKVIQKKLFSKTKSLHISDEEKESGNSLQTI